MPFLESRCGRALLLALLACIGLVAGIVGHRLTGDSAWFLAVPAVIAAGWLFVADPTRCAPNSRHDTERTR